MRTRIPTQHSVYECPQSPPVHRTGSEYFAPPAPSGQREPGTNWFTIITTPTVTTWGGREAPRPRGK